MIKKRIQQQPVTDYFDHLISSISPIVTFNQEEKIKFVNSSFMQEFTRDKRAVLGKNIFTVLGLSVKDKAAFVKNITAARAGFFVNSEFRKGNRVFGYSVFNFDKDTGIILKDITDKKKLEGKIKKLHSDILKLQEKERQKLAAELHDGVGQTILAAKLNFIAYKNDPDRFNDKFDTGLQLIDQVSQELREIYTDLYPSLLKDIGLEAAIRSFLKNLFKPSSTNVDIHIKLPVKMGDDLAVNLYRITQEIATNAAKHARPANLEFKLVTAGKFIELEVMDDGPGFAPEAAASRGFGLENIKRRVDDLHGTIKIISSTGGAGMKIRVPVKQGKHD